MYSQRLNLSDLQVDESYQRDVVSGQVKRIVKNYKPAAVGVLVIAKRKDGSLWIVDGRQRATALAQLGIESADCHVIESDGRKFEAQLFGHLNGGRTAVTAIGRFWANVAAEEPAEVGTLAEVQKAGFVVAKAPSRTWPKFTCVRALLDCHRWQVLPAVLETIYKAWPEDEDALHNALVAGVGGFYRDYPQAKLKVAAAKFKRLSAASVLQKASARRVGGNISSTVVDVLRDLYNWKLVNKLPARHS